MNNRGRAKNDSVEELSFEDDAPPPRAGDPRFELDEITPTRVRDAGLSGGEILSNPSVDAAVTSDDLSPETLLDEDSVDDDEAFNAADKDLSIVEEDDIGGGSGFDEAELAQITGRPE